MDDLLSKEDKVVLRTSKKFKASVYLKREDLLHEEISGNKWRKLRYNLFEFEKSEAGSLLTFGGAYSNHIAAVAAFGRIYGIKTIGIIRGEEILPFNPTLKGAVENGMELHFVSRSEYKSKHTSLFLDKINKMFNNPFIIPEGGANKFGVKGCMEIVGKGGDYDYIACAAGTGATCAGILLSMHPSKKLLCFPALKGGGFIKDEIETFLRWFCDENEVKDKLNQLEVITNYHFGGFGKITQELAGFMKNFNQDNQIRLDPIYTSKMLFGLSKMIDEGYFINKKRILAIHTGGLQGILGIEGRYRINLFE